MADTPISSQIYLSRDQIRSQITDYIKTYLELENVDLTKTSFLSFIVNLLSTLTSNLMFYQSSVYREFFLTKAQLPESIFNLSAFLGYNPSEADFSVANVLITMPLGFEDPTTTITIPNGFKFYAEQIQFVTTYETVVTITNNNSVSIIANNEGKIYNIPVNLDTTANMEFSFVLPVSQKKTTVQEFQIDQDLQTYQFTTIDVPVSGQVSSLIVEMKDPDGTSWRTYDEYTSLYLMDSTNYGYVSRTTSTGRTLYFGNGLIGVQPIAGSTCRVTAIETEGEAGNVISGSIASGDRLYTTTLAGLNKVVNYTVINTEPATGGRDEESTDEIRNNAIASIRSLGRLVTEQDYIDAKVVVPNLPITTNSLPVLKRSDVKTNEIQLFVNLIFDNEIVPTRNAFETYPISATFIPRGEIITVDGVEYYTIFDMYPDIVNEYARYNYILYSTKVTPTLIRSYGSTYDLSANELTVSKVGNSAIYELSYLSTEVDYASATCVMQILESSQTVTMTNDSVNKKFTYTITPYTVLPQGQLTHYFTLSNTVEQVGQYSADVIFRRDLSSFMMSNASVDGTNVTIYDIPVVLKSYYDSIDQTVFELQVLQTMMESLTFSNYRMLTDFVNIKFTNAYGTMRNMLYNETTKMPVIDIALSAVPGAPTLGDRYIVGGLEGGAWTGYKNYIAQWTGSTWQFYAPVSNDVIYVENKGSNYIYSDTGWIEPIYSIPLQIELEVYKRSDYTGSSIELANEVKSALMTEFSSRFGSNIALYRSEIIETVQNVTGVLYCHLLRPQSNIYFNYNLDDFEQQNLLEYGAEYVYFTEDDITVRIF